MTQPTVLADPITVDEIISAEEREYQNSVLNRSEEIIRLRAKLADVTVKAVQDNIRAEALAAQDTAGRDILRADFERSQARIVELTAKWEADIRAIGEAFIEEFESDADGDSYDRVRDALVRKLTYELPEREQDFDVSVPFRIKFKNVRASNESAARDAIAGAVRVMENLIDNQSDLNFSTEGYPENYRGDWEVEESDD